HPARIDAREGDARSRVALGGGGLEVGEDVGIVWGERPVAPLVEHFEEPLRRVAQGERLADQYRHGFDGAPGAHECSAHRVVAVPCQRGELLPEIGTEVTKRLLRDLTVRAGPPTPAECRLA